MRNGIMGLSMAGCIASWAWPKTVSVYPRAVLDEFIVMPDHVHLILGLHARTQHNSGQHRTGGAQNRGPQREFGGGLTPHSVSSIVNHYKGRVTKVIRSYNACPRFSWQPRFYDRIIRSKTELDHHRRYVAMNPVRWDCNRPLPDTVIPK